MEAHTDFGPLQLYDRVKQAVRLETDRGSVLREAIMACRNGGTVSVIGVYGGVLDKFPVGSWMNRSITLKTGQCHVQRYTRPLLERIERSEIDPSFVITHRLPLEQAPERLRDLQAQARRLRKSRPLGLNQAKPDSFTSDVSPHKATDGGRNRHFGCRLSAQGHTRPRGVQISLSPRAQASDS